MARARNIKPGFFMNEYLGTCDPLEQLLFSGLWLLADREGRLEYRPLRIKAEIFPYRENLDMNGYIRNLSSNGFISIYEVDGKQYIQIENFAKHQNPHKNEKGSELPGIEKGKPIDQGPSGGADKIGKSSDKIGTARADSLIPDSLIPDSTIPIPENRFAEFWAAYPQKKGKAKAEQWWSKNKPSTELADQIISHLKDRVVQDPQWVKNNGDYIPHAPTFLNQKLWQDEYQRIAAQGQGSVHQFPNQSQPRRRQELPRVS